MRNSETWKPTKYVIRRATLRASSDRHHLGVSSRLTAQLVADAYGRDIPNFCRGDLADIGCGHVPMYEYYKPYVSGVTTIDWAESLHVNEHLDIIADLNAAPIPGVADNSFDTVVMSDVLEHIFEPQVLLNELHRILRPGGTLLMNIPFFYWIHEAPHDYHRYTNFALRRYLEGAGFEIVALRPLGGFGSCAVDLFSKGLWRIGAERNKKAKSGPGRIVRMPMKIPRSVFRFPFRVLATALQNTACFLRNAPGFRSFLWKNADSFPLGYFVVGKKAGKEMEKKKIP